MCLGLSMNFSRNKEPLPKADRASDVARMKFSSMSCTTAEQENSLQLHGIFSNYLTRHNIIPVRDMLYDNIIIRYDYSMY